MRLKLDPNWTNPNIGRREATLIIEKKRSSLCSNDQTIFALRFTPSSHLPWLPTSRSVGNVDSAISKRIVLGDHRQKRREFGDNPADPLNAVCGP
uniref:Uncharacterized protein n=1 Tax=Ascaris lumbricoides TaxID=6252 RepID=A0A0M3HWI2_ASCLU